MEQNPCVYCGAPWPDPDVDIDHAGDCPMVTGLYPVTDADLGGVVCCEACGHLNRPQGGFCCAVCNHQFKLGEHYVLRTVGEGDPVPTPVGDLVAEYGAIVCLSCEATSRPFEAMR